MTNPLGLGIFGALSQVRDKRAAREQAKVEQQQTLEDRLAQKEMRDLQKRSLEEALKPKPAAPVAWKEVETDDGMVQVNPHTGEVRQLGIRPRAKPETPEPLEQTVGPDGKVFYTPRSKAAGMQAPRPASSDDRTVVQVQREDGTIVYMPRSQAVGQQAPGRAGAGGTEKAKRVQALANVKDALDGFKSTLATTGSVVVPGADKSTLQTTYENLQLQMKELFNLGVLNGPDLLLMRRVLNDPTEIKGRLLAGGSGEEHTKRTMAQIAEVEKIIQRYQANLAEGMNAMDMGGGRSGGPGGGAKPPSSDPEFDALMARWKKP